MVSGTPSTVIYDVESDLITIDRILGTLARKPRPGQHYFIYQGGVLKLWANHPFQ
jgi:hypothetical protein